MYVIKMNKDKTLITTVRANVYRGEKNADTLVFLLPEKYDNKNLADCKVNIEYSLQDGTVKYEQLLPESEMYNGYYKYCLDISTEITDKVGTVYINLNCVDSSNDFLLKTSVVSIDVMENKNVDILYGDTTSNDNGEFDLIEF